jgi:hypothetical protein
MHREERLEPVGCDVPQPPSRVFYVSDMSCDSGPVALEKDRGMKNVKFCTGPAGNFYRHSESGIGIR